MLYSLFFLVKENLLQFEDLKEKYHHDCNIKEKEVSKMKIFSWVSFKMSKQPQVGKMWKKKQLFPQVAGLQTKLKDKENELHKILHEFGETQKHCGQLQETTSNMKFPISKLFMLIMLISFWTKSVKE